MKSLVLCAICLLSLGCVAEPVCRNKLQQKYPEYAIELLPGSGTEGSNPYLLKSSDGDILYVEVVNYEIGPAIVMFRH